MEVRHFPPGHYFYDDFMEKLESMFPDRVLKDVYFEDIVVRGIPKTIEIFETVWANGVMWILSFMDYAILNNVHFHRCDFVALKSKINIPDDITSMVEKEIKRRES